MPNFVNLAPGDPAPWFFQRSFGNPNYAIHTAGGRYIVLCFFSSAADPQSRAAIDAVMSHRSFFNDERGSLFGVSLDQTDETEKRVADRYPGCRFLWDFDGRVSKLYGAIPVDAEANQRQVPVRRLWIVLDPTLRVLRVIPFAPDRSDTAELLTFVESLPPPARFAGFELQAPILVLPNVFEPEFCRELIGLYEAGGGEESGFVREIDGKTVIAHDHSHKRRRDFLISDPEVRKATVVRLKRSVVPEIAKVHQFRVTRLERYIVSCYAAEDEAHFSRIATTPPKELRIAALPCPSTSMPTSTAAK